MRDDREFNIKFVTLVEVHPCLYDNTREDYRMSNVQERAWAKIVKNIGEGATIADCKKRWKNLRGSYTKHLKTYVPSGSGASVKRAYYLSGYLGFVLPFTKSRQPKGNVKSQKYNETADILNEEIFTEDLKTEEHEQLESPNVPSWKLQKQPSEENNSDDEQLITEEVNQDVDVMIVNQGKQKKKLSSSSVLSDNKSKKYKTTENQITLEDINKSAFEYFEKKKVKAPAFTNDDADVQFLLSLLPDLKKMTDKQKRKYKVRVLNLAGEILDEPEFHTSALHSSPATTSYSSLVDPIPSLCQTANSQPCSLSLAQDTNI